MKRFCLICKKKKGHPSFCDKCRKKPDYERFKAIKEKGMLYFGRFGRPKFGSRAMKEIYEKERHFPTKKENDEI